MAVEAQLKHEELGGRLGGRYLEARTQLDVERALVPAVDVDAVGRHLESVLAVCSVCACGRGERGEATR